MKKGTTRYVFFIGKYAIKIPSMHSYTNFLWGLLANMQEVKFNSLRDNRLCPIIFNIPFGILNIMPKCDAINEDQFKDILSSNFRESPFIIPVESKIDSFGILENKIVAVDYG